MKTLQLLSLSLFLSLTAFTNAQDASFEETEDWINSYGNNLLTKRSDGNAEFSIRIIDEKLNYEWIDFYFENGKKGIFIKNTVNNIQLTNLESIKAIHDNDNEYRMNIKFGNEVKWINEKVYKNEKPKTDLYNQVEFNFKSEDGMMRYYKALKHLFELKGITHTKFSENVTLENKF